MAELLRQAQEVDEEEDPGTVGTSVGTRLPEELAFREGRLEKIGRPWAALEAGA